MGAKDKQIVHLPIKKIEYDKTNPRITHLFSKNYTPNADEISFALRDQSSHALRRAIREFGEIINPIKVYKLQNGKYIVFEGNTRLSIYIDFDEKGEEGNWNTISAFIFDDISETEIDKIRIQDHMVGTVAWAAYAKAKYLYELHHDKNYPLQSIAALCGLSQTSILHSIEAYIEMNGYYRTLVEEQSETGTEVDPMFNERQYTAFEEFVKRSKVRTELVRHGYNSKDFAKWIINNKFSRNEDVRILPSILNNENAMKVFLEDCSREAKKYLDTPSLSKQLQEASLLSLCKAITVKVMDIKRREIDVIKENDDQVAYIEDTIENLRQFVDSHLTETET